MIPFFRRLDKRWKSNRNLRDDKLDYSHLTKFEKSGYLDLVAQRRKEFLGTFPTKLRLDEDNGPSCRLDYFFANQALAQKCIDARYLVNKATDVISDHYPAIRVLSRETLAESFYFPSFTILPADKSTCFWMIFK